jgi:type VI secretion system protein ImpG
MDQKLLGYYERELSVLRHLGQEFAQTYPKVAGRLQLESNKCEDPHVERLIEAFAFLAARVHLKIDDEFPEITDALLGMLYPHYLAPIPSLSVVEFVVDPEQGKLTSGYQIPSGTQLYSRPVDGTQCRFRTCYPTTLWPLNVATVKVQPADRALPGGKPGSVVKVELQAVGGLSLKDLHVDRLRFYLHGEAPLAYAWYELLLNHVYEVRCQPIPAKAGEKAAILPSGSVRPVGFLADEGLLPYPRHSLLGYRLLQEYFTFPQKFLFIDIVGLQSVFRGNATAKVELHIVLDQPPRTDQIIGTDNLKLGCTPIVNLFNQIAEPIRIDQTQHRFQVIPDVRKTLAHEIYSIDSVTLVSRDKETTRPVQPIYSLNHTRPDREQTAFWFQRRVPSDRKGDQGTEVYVSLVDLKFDPMIPAGDTLTFSTTCTNRTLPTRLAMDDPRGDFELEKAAPLSRIRSLIKPTTPLRPPLGGELQWRLISHLSLNYLSLIEGGSKALQEILKLYDLSNSTVSQQHIDGILDIRSKRVTRRLSTFGWNGFCRGMEVTVEFDETKYVGSSVFLFASVLEKYFALYASLNSFTQLVARVQQRERPLKQWPPRAGEQILV